MSIEMRGGVGLLLLLVTFLAFLLRVYQLDAASLRGDEAFTVNFVQRTWDGLWRGIRFIEPNPPVLYLALRAWIAVHVVTSVLAVALVAIHVWSALRLGLRWWP